MMGMERMLVFFGEIGEMAGLHDLQLPETDEKENDERIRTRRKPAPAGPAGFSDR